jgi:hypothetical protein
MAELKTTKNAASVTEFLDAVADPQRRADAIAVCALMGEVTGAEPTMWGTGIIGFGTYHYKYASGQKGDWPVTPQGRADPVPVDRLRRRGGPARPARAAQHGQVLPLPQAAFRGRPGRAA